MSLPPEIEKLLASFPYEVCIDLEDGVQRVTQKNPGPFTGPGTNTHIVGSREVFLLDPGVEDDVHFAAVVEAVGDRRVRGVFSSHAHPDHWPLARRFADHFGSETLGFDQRSGFEPDRPLGDGEVLSTDDRRLDVLHTPGHASDHLCLHDASGGILFSGDHIMGWSTTIIGPPDGSLNDYMASMERLLTLDFMATYSAHGHAIEDGPARARELFDHRNERTEQALAALAQGPAEVVELVRTIYADTPEHLHGAAAQSLWAHLEALVESGQVLRTDGDPLEATYRLS
ncbi:MAG: MBL fold metallo-hydrolase [Acidobacteriota bacterium]